MWKDPIVEEVRTARDAYARRFGYDLKKMGADLMKRQAAPTAKSSGRRKSANSRKRRPATDR